LARTAAIDEYVNVPSRQNSGVSQSHDTVPTTSANFDLLRQSQTSLSNCQAGVNASSAPISFQEAFDDAALHDMMPMSQLRIQPEPKSKKPQKGKFSKLLAGVGIQK
jgi:hypothetical protein